MSTLTAQALSIGPGSIADQGVPDGPGFTLSRPEWVAIQTYCTNALSLPTTDATFRASLGSGAPADLADFVQLIEAYRTINGHVTTWETTTFPATVALASDVYQFGAVKAPVFYPRILAEAQILQDHPDDEQAKAALKAILDNLKGEADDRAGRADAVARQVQQFGADSEADRLTLVGKDGSEGLVKYYDDRYGKASEEVASLLKEITAQNDVLKAADAEYNHDVTVAGTSPTYAWVWPLGTIAAAVVAGIYGKRATEALDRARAAQRKIDELQAKLGADANLMTAIHVAQRGMTSIATDLTRALPVIQKIQGVWGSISADLASISAMVDTDIRNVPPIIMDLGVDASVRAWHQVALKADAYRLHAYVRETPGVPSMHAWRAATQFSSSRVRTSRLVAA